MEGKRNRLKRKPKVSPVPTKDGDRLVQKTGGNDDHSERTDVIIIDEDSPTSLATSESKAEANDSRSAEASRPGDGAWRALVDALSAIVKQRQRLPLQTLPDLPDYQAPEVIPEEKTLIPKTASPWSDLSPLPAMCPCRLKHRRKAVVPPPPPSGQPLTTAAAPQKELSPTNQPEELDPPPGVIRDAGLPSPRDLNPGKGQLETAPTRRVSGNPHPPPHLYSGNSCQSKQQKPAPLKAAGGTHPKRCKLSVSLSGSGLFSKFSSMQDVSDDVDEFEETARLTGSNTKAAQPKPVGGKSMTGKRPSDSLESSLVSKKAKLSMTCADVTQTPVTKSLLVPSGTKPLFSASKSNPVEKSQPRISQFSTKASTSSFSSRASTNKTLEQSSLGNLSVSTSRESQQGKFLDNKPPAKVNIARPGGASGPGKDSAAKDASSSWAQSSRVSTPVWSGKGTEVPPRHGKGKERGGARGDKAAAGEGSSVAGSRNERVKLCPLCQTAFSTVMSQMDIDAHIAACLSVADDDDIVW